MQSSDDLSESELSWQGNLTVKVRQDVPHLT